MANTLVMLTCAVADGFLLYVLFQFTRELRKGRRVRATLAAIPISKMASEQAPEHRQPRKVIDITYRSLWSSQNPSRHRAF
jgi:hypothetical protein